VTVRSLKRQANPQSKVLFTSETLVYKLKVELFNCCLKLFSVICLSVTRSLGTCGWRLARAPGSAYASHINDRREMQRSMKWQ
jgi:hypothetical protein